MTGLKLGSLKLDTDLLLAPMMDVTTPSYIKLIQHYGGLGLFTMPMVFINQIIAAPKTVRPFAEFVENNRPSGIQICGSGKSIEHIEKAIEILNAYDFDFIDINSGCPARHTCNSGGGASLMKSHRFNDLQNLVKNTIRCSNKPVSVKIRLGWKETDGLEEIVKMVEDEGADFLTVHGRVAAQNYSGIIDYELVKQIKEWINIPVVANGDVINYESYKYLKEYTGADAIMIGRAAQGFPELFKEINDHSKNGHASDNWEDYYGEPRNQFVRKNSAEQVQGYIKKLLEIIEGLDKFWNNERFKVIELRRNAIWMLKGAFNAANVRPKLGKLRDLDPLLDYLLGNQFIEDLRIPE